MVKELIIQNLEFEYFHPIMCKIFETKSDVMLGMNISSNWIIGRQSVTASYSFQVGTQIKNREISIQSTIMFQSRKIKVL